MHYWDLFLQSFLDYGRYFLGEIPNPHLHNYLYWLIVISIFAFAWELFLPWRKHQKKIRRDFWLDGFYMIFNFFLFSLIGYFAIATVAVTLFNDGLAQIGITNLVAIRVDNLPVWAQLLSLFVIRDFIHWCIHRLLHRVPWLWEFHKVHHSVRQMGFAAHLRYHWMETVVYRSLEYLPLALIGFGIDDFLIVHLIALTIGHLNHANIVVPLGPLKYLFNNPQMHIWHHARNLPDNRPYGMNFGISLSLWDYLFGSAYVPESGRDIPLGFEGLSRFPESFVRQVTHPWSKKGN